MLLLWTECLCLHKIQMLKPDSSMLWCLEVGLLGGKLGHDGGAHIMGLESELGRILHSNRTNRIYIYRKGSLLRRIHSCDHKVLFPQ